MIQTIALENICDKDINPDFNAHIPFFESKRGVKTQEYARQKLARYKESENFSKMITFRLMREYEPKLTTDTAMIISHHKLGKKPVTALIISVMREAGGLTIKVKARVR